MDNIEIFQIQRVVKEVELEPRYKHVHHSTALLLLEESRIAFLDHIECPLESYLSQKLFLVISRMEVLYKREIRAEPVKITCENPRISGKRVSLDQRILNERGKDCVVAVVEMAFLSGHTGRSMAPPDNFLERFVICSRQE